MRIEHDSLGPVEVPDDALYGAQTQRAVENFRFSRRRLTGDLVQALGRIKQACAEVNGACGRLSSARAEAIATAAAAIAEGAHADQFPVDIFQTGSGTSSNMNVNEVVARLATHHLGEPVHPNDHVNCSQSSNDVFPSALRIAVARLTRQELLPALEALAQRLDGLAAEQTDTVKTGRTHLMDAVPITLAQECWAWRDQVCGARAAIAAAWEPLTALPLGGTAVGTGLNAPEDFGAHCAARLADSTGVSFRAMDNPFLGLGNLDAWVVFSGALAGAAASLRKIAEDLRWMNSGPHAGLAEVQLPALQPGSSIMPGKVNPVIPEAVAMAAVQVMGNNGVVGMAAQSSHFQLNVMFPVVASNILESVELLTASSRALADQALVGLEVNRSRMREALERNPMLVTALTPVIGYDKAAAIAHRAAQEERSIRAVATEETELDAATLDGLLDLDRLAHGGRTDSKA